jgi:hypothetical protein
MGVDHAGILFVGYYEDELTEEMKEHLKTKGVDLDSEDYEFDGSGYLERFGLAENWINHYSGSGYLIGVCIAFEDYINALDLVDTIKEIYDAREKYLDYFGVVPKLYLGGVVY